MIFFERAPQYPSQAKFPLDPGVIRTAVIDHLEKRAVKTEGEAFEAWLYDLIARLFYYAKLYHRTFVRMKTVINYADLYAAYCIRSDRKFRYPNQGWETADEECVA